MPAAPPQLPPLSGLVLLGGLSRRMGSDKAAQRYHSQPQALWAYQALQAVCGQVFLSIRADQDAVWLGERPVIRDSYHNLGPAAGLLSAADAAPGSAWLLLACDMPLVTAATLSALVAARSAAAPAVAYRHADGTPEPLCAIYEPGACQALQRRIESGEGSSLRGLLEALRCRWLEAADARALRNANDPAQRAELTAHLEQRRRG